jgi:hypothetical protein
MCASIAARQRPLAAETPQQEKTDKKSGKG